MAIPISVKAPGRVCFFGDHQDYLGLPVIAATINRYIYLEATPKEERSLTIELRDLNRQETILLEEDLHVLAPRDYFRSALRVLKRAGIRIEQGHHIVMRGDIPIQAGLSSSSAMVVAWIRLLLKIAQPNQSFSNEQIAQWSYTAEVLEFNEPGGLMDQYTIALGGTLFLNTITGAYKRLITPWERLVIGDSGIEKSTLGVLSKAKENALAALTFVQKKHPSFLLENTNAQSYEKTKAALPTHLQAYWYAALHNFLITKAALKLFEQTEIDLEAMGRLMNAHQAILQNQIKNTPQEMNKMLEAALKNGAQGAKIVGSGGGGCFVAPAPKTKEKNIIKAIEAAGARQAFSVKTTAMRYD